MRGLLKECWALARPYWKSEDRWRARLLLAVIVGLGLGEVYITVLINQWNNDFYNSLQEVNKDAFFSALIRFSYLAFAFILIAVYRVYLNQMLRIRWRRWMTAHYLSDWLGKRHYYRMQLFGGTTDNPDQRISEDIEQFIQLTLGLSLGLLSAVVTLASFVTILWNLSGSLPITIGGMSITIPGYMVWAAIAYAVVGTWLTAKIGRPLVALNFNQQRFEADFRFGLVRLREYSESVAFYRGEAQEQSMLMGRFNSVVENFWAIMKRQKSLTWLTSGYGQLAIIFPFVVSAPRFFAKEIQLGGLMQTASAFGHVQGALSYIVESYQSIAGWRAVMDRLGGFQESLKQADNIDNTQLIRQASGNNLATEHLNILFPNGQMLLSDINLQLQPGDRLLVTGPSGAGKSTLLRTLAGLWPFAEGILSLPDHSTMLFLPQKPYLPIGTLREALCYPKAPIRDNDLLESVLNQCGLDHLKTELDTTALWSQILSPGQQQRLGFARIFLTKPAFLFMDESTSALDEASEATLYNLLGDELPNAAVVSVAHRSTLRPWHTQALEL